MWELSESEDILEIKTTPLLIWALVFAAFIFGLYFLFYFFSVIGGISNLVNAIQQKPISLIFVAVTVLSFLFGIVFFHFLPMTIFKFNRQKQEVSQTKYTLFGKKTRRFGYSYLQSNVQVYTQTSDGSEYHLIFFYIEGGEKIFLPSKSLWSKEAALEIADKINVYLKKS